MKKRYTVIVLIAVLFVLCCSTPSMARIWSARTLSFDVGMTPSMALLYGVQPVISNYDLDNMGSVRPITRLTAFGEETYQSVSLGYIAGDGDRTIVSYNRPVIYGNDGRFYSTIIADPIRPKQINGGTGPAWINSSSYGPYAVVNTDANGDLFMAYGNLMAKLVNGVWSSPIQLYDFGIETALDLEVSSFGDIAVFGLGNDYATIAWYDYETNDWNIRQYELFNFDIGNIKWDSKGNLGFAYSTGSPGSQSSRVKFDYLDKNLGIWTNETVDTGQGYFSGVALEYDRLGNPVIASGKTLFYDPIVPVPEPSSILVLASALLSASIYRRKK